MTVAHYRRFCPLYAENDEPYFPGWGESFRDVRVQNARPVPRTAGTGHRGRVSGAHSQSRDSRYPAAARCQALCQRFPLVISWRARVTGGSGWWSRGPNLPATPGARGKSASSPHSPPALASFLYLFPASLSASLWPLHFASFVLGTSASWLLALTRNCEFPHPTRAFPILKTEIV